MNVEQIQTRVHELGQWFHNLDLNGVYTAPNHFLGNYPESKWRRFESSIPADLTGKTVLDIGCNGGFYSLQMKNRGAARVVGIDCDPDYLAQARFAAEVTGTQIEFRELDVYNVEILREKFDLVLFMGVSYHLRHPLLALDLLYQHVVKDLLVFQSLTRGSLATPDIADNYPFDEEEMFMREGFPVMHFIEHSYADDPTNWWIPNRACVEAMLRSSGFEILSRPEMDVYLCRRSSDRG